MDWLHDIVHWCSMLVFRFRPVSSRVGGRVPVRANKRENVHE